MTTFKLRDLDAKNQTRTAKQLDIGSATLYRRLRRYGMVGGIRSLRDADVAAD